MRHHPRHQQTDRRRTARPPIDVLDIDGLGDDAQRVADAAEVVDGHVAQARGAELEAEEVEVQDGDGVREAVGDGVGEAVLVEELGQEVEAVARPGVQGEDVEVDVQEGREEGDAVAEEALVDADFVARGAALEADEGALEEARVDWLEVGIGAGSDARDVPAELSVRGHWIC